MDNIYKAVQLTIDSENLALSKTPTHVYIANQYVDTNDTPLITAPFIIQKALENGTGVVDIVSSTIGSIYEVRLLCDAEVLIGGYFYMPPMNVKFSELELYTSYPPRTPPVVNEFWQKTENFILEKTNTLLNFVQVFNAVSGMRLSLGYLEELATDKKSNLVSAINEIFKVIEPIKDDGLTDQLIALSNGRTQADKNSDFITAKDYGAIGDGTLHPLSERFATLADAQKKYPHATSLNDSIDWAALQQAINNYNLSQRAIYLSDNKLHIGDKTISVKSPITVFGASNLGMGAAKIIYSGDDVAIRFKTDNYVFGDYSKWIYGASFSDLWIMGVGGNAKKALELWSCSECNFDKVTIGASSDSKFVTGVEFNNCSINTFNNVVGSYNDVMYDFKVNPKTRFGDTAATYITGGDYYANKAMFKMTSVSALYVQDLWIESCDNLLIIDDAIDEFEIDNVFFDNNYVLMNTATSNKILSIKNNVGKKSRILSMHFNKNVFRYNHADTRGIIPIDIKSYEKSDGYNVFDMHLDDNTYYGFADALVDANATQINLNLKDNRNLDASTYKNTIKDTTTASVFTGTVTHTLNDSVVIGRNSKNRGAAALVIDNANGDESNIAVYGKAGSYAPLLAAYDGNGNMASSINWDGSVNLNYINLPTNHIYNANGALTYGSNKAGDVVINNDVSATKPITNWTCVTSGSPGTWQQSAHIVTTGATSTRPTLGTTDIGVMYFDTTLAANGKPIWWTGSKWVDANGNQV